VLNKAKNVTLCRVAKVGEKVPIRLLLAAIRTLKCGFDALHATFWATF